MTNDTLITIDYKKITHLNIAFENPDTEGNLSFSTVNQNYIREARAQGVKVLVSLAGGGASHHPEMQNLYFRLIADDNRSKFVDKIATYLQVHEFDGVDIDLEGPAINADYAKFIRDLASRIKPSGKLLTAALTHANGADKIPGDVIALFDFVNIMAYDATGPWNPEKPGQHASFEFAMESLAYWMKRGLPKEKAILGVPFYGYGFGRAFNEGMGYGQIIALYPGAENRDVAGDTIYYNGIATIKQKANVVAQQGYGGIMIWQLAHDATGPWSLLQAIHEVLQRK